MECNREYNNLETLMKTYDPDLNKERTTKFKEEIENLDLEICVPLDKDETTIYRHLIGILEVKSVKELAKEMDVHEFYIERRIVTIREVLKMYFYNVNTLGWEYPAAVNESNENITIFNHGISYRSICILRKWKCYYLKDVACLDMEFVKENLNEKDYNILIKKMKEAGLPIDWYEKKIKLINSNPENELFY